MRDEEAVAQALEIVKVGDGGARDIVRARRAWPRGHERKHDGGASSHAFGSWRGDVGPRKKKMSCIVRAHKTRVASIASQRALLYVCLWMLAVLECGHDRTVTAVAAMAVRAAHGHRGLASSADERACRTLNHSRSIL